MEGIIGNNEYGLNIKDFFQLETVTVLLNTNKILIKINSKSDLLEFYVTFKHFLEKYNAFRKQVLIIQIDQDLQILKKKSKTLKDMINPYITSIIRYEHFIRLLDEIHNPDYQDSGVHFEGEILGLEIRVDTMININKTEEILLILKKLKKEKIDFSYNLKI